MRMVCNNSGFPELPTTDDTVTDNNDIVMANDSESDEEINEYHGYEPLPMNGDQVDNNYYGAEEEDVDDNPTPDDGFPPIIRAEDSLVQEVWTSNSNVVDIEMDKAKEDEVKLAMAGITLPASSIPEWANSIPEEQWKEHLMKRLETLQKNE